MINLDRLMNAEKAFVEAIRPGGSHRECLASAMEADDRWRAEQARAGISDAELRRFSEKWSDHAGSGWTGIDIALRDFLARRSVPVTATEAAPKPSAGPWDPSASPGMTDMMVPPETLDKFMASNPLPAGPSLAELAEDAAYETAWPNLSAFLRAFAKREREAGR